VLAAVRAGVKTVFFPRANEKDLSEIPDYVKKRVHLMPVAHLDEVYSVVFKQEKTKPNARRAAAKPSRNNHRQTGKRSALTTVK
jgi:ATP-dependent Lon protease